jgi:hypothetical protein
MKTNHVLKVGISAFSGAVLLVAGVPSDGAEWIHPDTIVPSARYSDAPNWELGTIFRPLTAGKITRVRVFSLAEESGEHQVRVWRNADNALVAGPIAWTYGGEEAWITLDIEDVPVQAGAEYTVSVSVTADGWYPANSAHFPAEGGNGQHLAHPAAAGVFSETAGARPDRSFGNSSYLRDVVFEPDLSAAVMELRGNSVGILDGSAVARLSDNTQFGGVEANQGTREMTFTILNSGGSNLLLSGNPAVVITGPQAADFTVTAQPSSPVPAGGSVNFTVRFQPTEVGVRPATVVITNSANPGNPYDFGIEGVGTGPGNLVVGNASEGMVTTRTDDHWIAGNRHVALRSLRVTELRAKTVGTSGFSARFQCAVYSDKDGQADRLLGSTAEISNPGNGWQTFALKQPVNLAAGTYYWLVIWSDAIGARVYADVGGTLQRGDYAYADWPGTVALTPVADALTYCLYAEGTPADATGAETFVKGNGKPVPVGVSTVATANGTDFGGVTARGGSRETVFTILNVGKASLDLTGNPKVAINGPQAGDFVVTAQPPAAIPAGGSASFTVRFSPAAVGPRGASASIARSDNAAKPYEFALQGKGLGGGAAVIGHDSEGAFARDINDAAIHGNRFQAPVDMRITELRAKVLELEGTFKCAVYSDSQGWADRLLRGSVDVAGATNGWNTFALTSPLDLTGGECYWLVIWSDTVGARVQADPVGLGYYGTYAFLDTGGTWPDPIELIETSRLLDPPLRTYCIYAEGTPRATAPGPELDLRGNGKLIESGDTSPVASDGTDFGSADVGAGKRDQVFTVANLGDQPLNLTGDPKVKVAGAHAGDFVVTAQPASPIPPGGSATFTVRFDPTTRGLREATVSIASDDVGESPFEFAVSGAGFASGRETLWPDTKQGKDINFDGTYYELGTVFQSSMAGKITHLRVYSLNTETGNHTGRLWRNADETVVGGPYTWNYGGATGWILLDIPDVDIEANAEYTVSISTGTSPKRNYPNVSADLNREGNNGLHLSYPVNAGVFATANGARPTQSYNGGNYLRDIVFVPAGATVDLPDIELKGNSVVITNGSVTATLADGTDFGAVAVGGYVERVFTILNTGNAPLNLTSNPKVALSGARAADFAVVAQPGSPVAPGASTTFTLRFSPAEAGQSTARVTLENDSDRNPFSFAIGGAGAAVSLRIIEIKADAATGSLTLVWTGASAQFQVEKAATPTGPFQAVGAPSTAKVYTEEGVLKTGAQSYYRIRGF